MKVQMELGWERTGKAKMKMKEEGTEKRNSRPVIATVLSLRSNALFIALSCSVSPVKRLTSSGLERRSVVLD